MKAIVWTKYGAPDVLQFQEVAKPTPKDNEVLIKTYAATVTTGDCEFRALKFPIYLAIPIRFWLGFRKPVRNTILGMEIAGEIETVGKDVTRLKTGDQVFGTTGMSFGAYAEYTCLPVDSADGGSLAIKSANMTYEEAAALPVGGFEALHFLRKAGIQAGQRVLINGAGGTIGTFAVQLAKHFGAEVTAIDSPEKLEMLRSIGADYVLDYTQQDFTQNGEIYDVIFDVVGNSSFSRSRKSLAPKGFYLIANPSLSHMLLGLWTSRTSDQKVIFGSAGEKLEDLIFLKELVEAGKIKSVIGKRYALEQVCEAHQYVETGRKQGSVVITVANS